VSADVSGSCPLLRYVSIVLPCYNEQEHVVAEVERICEAMDASSYNYALVAYDDAPTDETFARLREAAPRFPHLQLATRIRHAAGQAGHGAPAVRDPPLPAAVGAGYRSPVGQ
jgi:cellulose synthase/poly-beta-1,6-N-acetylglucosamine synthase-like glycosyltransferase